MEGMAPKQARHIQGLLAKAQDLVTEILVKCHESDPGTILRIDDRGEILVEGFTTSGSLDEVAVSDM